MPELDKGLKTLTSQTYTCQHHLLALETETRDLQERCQPRNQTNFEHYGTGIDSFTSADIHFSIKQTLSTNQVLSTEKVLHPNETQDNPSNLTEGNEHDQEAPQ
ncbi:hypothetical protein UY3_04925 [Chelonia mydas]|uniref:Uncharacterized protein n=1 Tax=Chelonia mydas TaxID=8469 RepID=M7BQ89_CHEMY|nr:hypothetical protein UY3_04925 [Chelonia mydas]